MSQVPPTTPRFQTIFRAAEKEYKKKTKKDIASHPLAAQLECCKTPSAILAVLRAQVQVFDQSQRTDEKLTKWLDPTVNVLLTFSETLGNAVGLAFPPATVIFTGIGVLLQAIKDVRASRGALVDLFGRIEFFFKRLGSYTEVQPTTAMTDIIVEIMAEVLSILGTVTKEIAEGQTKKYFKKLVRWNGAPVEDAVQRLDRLTQEEARMVDAELLLMTHGIYNGVKGAQRKLDSFDQSFQTVILSVQSINEKQQGFKDQLQGVSDKVSSIPEGEKEITVVIRQLANQVSDLNHSGNVRKDLRKWISPLDPSINYNTACETHHNGTATWCTESKTFADWKASGSLLWIHGKPGSGKSVVSSVIIRELCAMSAAGSAHLAYFYFDSQLTGKQDSRALLSSLLVQLCQSDQFCGVLLKLYSKHQNGSQRPTTESLAQCLKEMLSIAGQVPVYFILDALDECPTDFLGMPPPRDKVLDLVDELVGLDLDKELVGLPRHPNLRLCVTSRLEYDIRTVLEPLATQQISLHDEIGQKEDIDYYIRYKIHSDKRMKEWPKEVQDMVVEKLTEKADGMFRWVFCQLEVLRHCFQHTVLRALEELPESLDETYERILKGINEASRKPALRLLQCLTVTARPLRVEELAEVLAIEFNTGRGTNSGGGWRWEDQQDAVLSACSSLVSVITDGGGDQVVQFSHSSVKEFLTSDRLAKSTTEEVSQFHISLDPAHAILAHACLSVLLRLDEHTNGDSFNTDPLLPYAAECWVKHVQFKDVELRTGIKDAMDSLFDMDKPHFSAWVRIQQRLRDLLDVPADSETPTVPSAAPLYVAAYHGFRGLVERMIVKHPQHVNACCGEYGTPLHSSILAGHIEVAELLLAHGADVNAPGTYSVRPLYVASRHGRLDAAKWLLDHGADVNAQRVDGQTALHSAALRGHLDVARMLLEHNADVGARDAEGCTPLSLALERVDGGLDVARLLLDNNADVDARDNRGKTPLHYAAAYGHLKVARLLLERNAQCDAKDDEGSTPLRCASEEAELDLVQLLLDHGADVDARDSSGNTPLHQAAINTLAEVARILLACNAEVDARNDCGSTPLHLASEEGDLDVVSLLLDHGADVQVRDDSGNTPLDIASANGHHGVTQLLLDRDLEEDDAQSDDGSTPSHLASEEGDFGAVSALLDRFADAQVRDNGGKTAPELAGDWEQQRIARLLSAEMTADSETECSIYGST